MHPLRFTRVPRYRHQFILNIRSYLVRKPHQTPHKLVKRSMPHGFVLVEFVKLQTSRKWVIPPRTNTKPRLGVLRKHWLPKRRSTSIPVHRQTATSIPPQLAQVVDQDKAVKVFTEHMAPTLPPHCKYAIHMNHCCDGD